MNRVRLTKRASRSRVADSATPQTAIDLGKNRTYHEIDEYHTFEQSVNHELPDMRHDWKNNPREETGHGIPKIAKVYMAAKKATKLASLFLGNNASAELVEKQARAFMRMGDKALTASLNLYAECVGESCKEEPVASEEEVVASEEEVVAGEEEVVASEEEVVAEETVEAPVEAPVEEPVVEQEADVQVSDDLISTDIEFDEPADGADTTACADLQACFNEADDGEEVVAPAGQAVARKAGVKKLAGQPTLVRVASKKADELSSLWDHWANPDVR